MTESSPPLVVMTWAGGWGAALDAAVSKPFTAVTGIPVHHEHHVGLKLPDALERALARGERPPYDVVWCNGTAALHVARQGNTVALDAGELPSLAELSPRSKPEGMRDRSTWPIVLAYVVYYVLVYDRALFPKGAPAGWDCLWDPRLRGRVALYPGGNGFYPIAQHLGGGSPDRIPDDMQPCWETIERLRPQLTRPDYSIGMGDLIRKGRVAAAFRALTNALAFQREGLNVAWTVPRPGTTDTVDALWIPRGIAPEKLAAAKAYIDFALTAEVQSRWCAALGTIPMHPRARVSERFEPQGLPRSADDYRGIFELSECTKADYQEAWEAEFDCLTKHEAMNDKTSAEIRR